MTSELNIPYVISLQDAARLRLPNIEQLTVPLAGATLDLVAALPVSYTKKARQNYPLLLVVTDDGQVGSVIEMCRLVIGTKEVREAIIACIVVPSSIPADELALAISTSVTAVCCDHWRIDTAAVYVHSADPALRAALPAAASNGVRLQCFDGPAAVDDAIPGLLRGLRGALATGKVYGSNVAPLGKPWLATTLTLLAPLMRALQPKTPAVDPAVPYLMRSACMNRDFEIFAVLPASAAKHPERRYPVLMVLDANIEFSTVAETAASLAAERRIEELIVVGIGVPRALGEVAFAFRRFEEFSPPTDGYDFGDDLGRVFLSLFAIRGNDARQCIGQAPAFHDFLVRELLPRLKRDLPVDAQRIGLAGHSAGGTMTGYALLQADSPFNRYLSVSPGVAISGSWILEQIKARSAAIRSDARLFLAVGSEELGNAFNIMAGIPQTEAYARRLRSVAGLDAHFHLFEGTTHSSVYP
ncbi:MAG: alpha/beta hydrolase-fold protein, partial [Pseudomonadota bacterium]|nr:alpha/beta hydrolase-fold protein [Pseudomonadota bacterium]